MTLRFALTRSSSDEIVVALGGAFDLASAPPAERKLNEIQDGEASIVVIDLRGLEFLDSTGLRVILGADSRARAAGKRLFVVRGSEPVQRVFRLTLLERRLDFIDDPSEIDDYAQIRDQGGNGA